MRNRMTDEEDYSESYIYAAFRGPLVRIRVPGGGLTQNWYGLKSFDHMYGTDLYPRFVDGNFTIIPEDDVFDARSAEEFCAKLDDPYYVDYILHNRKRDWPYERGLL